MSSVLGHPVVLFYAKKFNSLCQLFFPQPPKYTRCTAEQIRLSLVGTMHTSLLEYFLAKYSVVKVLQPVVVGLGIKELNFDESIYLLDKTSAKLEPLV